MSTPFLNDFLAQNRRPLLSSNLAVAINETIRSWFDQYGDGVLDQERILGSLAALMTQQILENPDLQTQTEITDRTLSLVLHAVKAEGVRRRMGGVQVTIVRQ